MLTKAALEIIQADLHSALKEVAKKHNLSMSGTRITFSANEFKLLCNFGDKSATGGEEVNPEYIRNLQRNGFMYGLTVDMINKTFKLPGHGEVKFQGLRGKFAIVKSADGKLWKYNPELVRSLIDGK